MIGLDPVEYARSIVDAGEEDSLLLFLEHATAQKSMTPDAVQKILGMHAFDTDAVESLAKSMASRIKSEADFLAYARAFGNFEDGEYEQKFRESLLELGLEKFQTLEQLLAIGKEYIRRQREPESFLLDQLYKAIPLPEDSALCRMRNDLLLNCSYWWSSYPVQFSIPAAFLELIEAILLPKSQDT